MKEIIKIDRLTITLEGFTISTSTTPHDATSDGDNGGTPEVNNNASTSEAIPQQSGSASSTLNESTTSDSASNTLNEGMMSNITTVGSTMDHLQLLKDETESIINQFQSLDDDDINAAMNRTSGLIKDLENDPHVGHFVPDLSGTLHQLHHFDTTRDKMVSALQALLDAIKDTMVKEKEKENKDRFCKMLQFLAQNADSIYDYLQNDGKVDMFNAIFGS